MNFEGEIETHITLAPKEPTPELIAWGESHGLKFVHIVLDRGQTPSQPMFTKQSTGTLDSELLAAQKLALEIETLGFRANRIKLEVPPWNEDVPLNSGHSGFARYFEHHVKILLPSNADLDELSEKITRHSARLSRNARRERPDGQQERFITQRLKRAGRDEAHRSLEYLLETVRGFEFPILEVEEEYVIYDSNLALDAGWIEYIRDIASDPTYPQTLRILNPDQETKRPQVFEPALRHFVNAFQLGEPENQTPEEAAHINSVRAEVRQHMLRLIAASKWRDSLVLRGSTVMQSWFGAQAREPKDIDWVFQPDTVRPAEPLAQNCLNAIMEMARQNRTTPNAEIIYSRIATDEIWTYERAEGRRILIPFRTNQGIERELQIDIVWQETLGLPPIESAIPVGNGETVTLWTVSREDSLAWKLMWLRTDAEPQGKDMYDAVLLAESTSLTPELDQKTRERIYEDEPSFGEEQTSLEEIFTRFPMPFWNGFQNQFPWVEGGIEVWHQRLLAALRSSKPEERKA